MKFIWLERISRFHRTLNSEGAFKIGMYINGNLPDMTSPIASAFPQR